MKTFVITDLEATCDNNNPAFPRSLREPIEIGAVAVNENFEIINEFQIFIKPIKTTKLTEFCKELTKIKQSDVDSAPLYEEAYYKFEDWFMKYQNPVFCSWGCYDFRVLDRECRNRNLEFYFKDGVNLKHLFGKKQNNGKELGLGRALNFAGMKFEGTQHRGIDDAKNIAKLLPYSFYDNNIVKKKN